MQKIITAEEKKYAPIEVEKLPEIGSQSRGHFLNCDYPTVCDRVDEVKADDGSTIYLAHYIRKSNGDDDGFVAFTKKEELK